MQENRLARKALSWKPEQKRIVASRAQHGKTPTIMRDVTTAGKMKKTLQPQKWID